MFCLFLNKNRLIYVDFNDVFTFGVDIMKIMCLFKRELEKLVLKGIEVNFKCFLYADLRLFLLIFGGFYFLVFLAYI